MPEISVQAADGSRQRFPVAKERLTIGRSRENDVFLPDQWLSRHHAEIRMKTEGYFVRDLGSKNGTLLNGSRIHDEERLRHGDVITLGEHLLTFSEDAVEDDDQELFGTRVFSARELSDISTQSGGALDEFARQNRILGLLSQAASAMLVHRPLNEVFDLVLELLMGAVPAERAAVLMLEGHPPQLVIKASQSRSGEKIAKVSRSIVRRVLDERVSLLLPNVLQDARLRSQDSILSTGIRSALCAPLWFTAGAGGPDSVIGMVYLDTLARAQPFSEDDLRIVTALANVAAAKIENARLMEESLEKRRMEEDMRMAADIQKSLLPTQCPAVPGYELSALNHPCRAVGGDYYDFGMEGGHLLVALGDVAGKGTGAALLMTVLRAAVRGHWGTMPLSEAVARINHTVFQNIPEGRYMTFVLARLDAGSGRLDYVNAGHNHPLLVRAAGKVETLEEGGTVLGMFDSCVYAHGSVQLGNGDTLLIFSDGVTETWDTAGEEFGDARLARVVAARHELSATEQLAAVMADLEAHSGGAKATDDRTLVVLKRK